MRIGIPKEVKNNEFRVSVTPSGVAELVHRGHEVFVEKSAGVRSNFPDEEYIEAGATMIETADEVWEKGDLIIKVKEPIAEEFPRMRENQVLFTYLHLAACTDCCRCFAQALVLLPLLTKLSRLRIVSCRCLPRCLKSLAAFLFRLAPSI